MRERTTSPDHDRRRSLGGVVAAWIEHYTVRGPGDVIGERVELDDELYEFLLDAYALDRNGRRLYDSAVLSRPKGRAKSEFAAFTVLAEALGPVRFAGFAGPGDTYRDGDFRYHFADGEPLARPVTSPFIRVMATEEQQAGNIYETVFHNLTQGPLTLPGDLAGLTRVYLPGGGEIRPSTAANASKDGGKETFAAFDELHLYTSSELRGMHATVRRNLAKRRAAEPWSLETTTMYVPGAGSVAEAAHDLARRIARGEVRRPRLLFDHRQGPDDVDLSDEDELRSALREAYGAFADTMDLRRLMDEIWDPRNSPSDSRRYFLNQPTSALDAWVAHYEWSAAADPSKSISPDDEVTLGFDGSRRRQHAVTDSTAIIGCRVSDGHLFTVGVWEEPPPPVPDDWQIPAEEVDAVMRQTLETFNVVGVYADPSRWETWVAGWERDYGARLRVKVSPSHPMTWWSNQARATAAAEHFQSAIVQQEMTHDGHPALTAHVLNARRRPNRYGVAFAKEHPESPRKVDAASAAVLATQARLVALGTPEPAGKKKKSGKVWGYT